MLLAVLENSLLLFLESVIIDMQILFFILIAKFVSQSYIKIFNIENIFLYAKTGEFVGFDISI